MTIWKFELHVGLTVLQMPKGAKVLTVQTQRDIPCVWALVDPQEEKEERKFFIVGTGHPFALDGAVYVGTTQELGGTFIWHVFEKTR